jgi:ankyrin repeat protein
MCSKAEPELMELELQQNTFLWAVLKGDLNTVESSAKSASAHLFLDFALKATLPSYKLTTLHLAVASGNLQLVNFFIKDGSYLQLIDKPALNNLSPLHIACTFGLLEIAQILIDNGGYPETVASAYPYFKQDSSAQRVIDFWLKNGATPSCTPILLAALSGHLEVVQFLLERKCYAAQEMNRMKGYLSDPVSCSIVAQSEKLLKFLLDTLPYDFNIVDRMGMTPLLLVAYACNNSKITELLMLKGANISVINPNNGNSAIHYAVMMGHESFVETLCNAKKNSEELQIAVNLTNVLQPNTPLQLASQIQDEETRERISSLLRANGATEKKMYSEIVKEGYLTKEGHVVKNWKKRWFVLKKGSLCYFASIEKLKNETGVISLENAILEDASDKKKPFCFAITDNVKNKKYYIQAPNETEKKDWFQALEYAIGK